MTDFRWYIIIGFLLSIYARVGDPGWTSAIGHLFAAISFAMALISLWRES